MLSNLPPGCTNNNIEQAFGDNLPPMCENCEHRIEENNYQCPINFRFSLCPHIEIIKRCAQCKKEMYIVPGLIEKECITHSWEDGYCCSKECANTLQSEIDKGIKELMES